ncbi:MAG: hypothetical protein MJZ87_06940 [Bacteroidales bacterium]|nr:hypothetical protein [Bacteroidales bacterium]
MKKILLIAIIGMFGGICFSQNIGYMGNHFIFNAEVSISPSWKNPNPLSEALRSHFESEHTQRYLGLNYFLSPNVEAIVWKKGTLGAGYNYYNTPIGEMVSRYYEGGGVSDYYFVQEDYKFTGNLVAHGFNVFYKQYLGDTQAPYGLYLKFVFDGYFYHYACNEPLLPNTQHWEENPEAAAQYDYVPVEKDGQGSIFGLKAELGYDCLFFNRLRLTMGATFGSTFGGYKWLKSKSDNSLFYNDNTRFLSVNDYVRNRMLNAYWFGIKLGVGIVAF